MDSKLLFSSASYVWSLHSICRLHRIPFAPKVALQQAPPPYSIYSIQQAAELIGFSSALRDAPPSEVPDLPLPCLAVLKPADSQTPTGSRPDTSENGQTGYRIALLIKYESGRLWYLKEGEEKPAATTLDEFAVEYAGIALLFERETASNNTTSTLVVIGIALGTFVLFTAAMSWIRQYLVLHTGNRIDAVLGSQVFEHLFKLPPRYFESRPTGVLVARVQGVETIREFLAGAAVMLILDVPFLLLFLGIMFFYSTTLTLITCAILLAIVGLSCGVTPLLRKRINCQFLLGARNQAFLTEYVSGMETVKSLQMEPQLHARYGDYLASYLKAGFETRQLANTYNTAAHALEQMMMVGILVFGALLVMNSREFTVGMLVAFQMFASRLSQPMLHLVGLWQQFQQADIAVKRLGDIMNVPTEPYSVIPAREARDGGDIEVRALSFRHADNLPYLYRDLSFTIRPGGCVAIMGSSGSGKSTLAKLLQGFYLPTDGTILLDGLDIRHRSANELRQYFGVVPQETVLFSGTVFENLVLGNPHADFGRVVRACKLAEIHDVIEQLPEGYQTRIGEHGVGLSGGQKQRIAIARALLKQPRILIFDEATSSLDEHTAEQFAKTVNRLKGKVTMIFIAHQLPKVLQVTDIVDLISN